MSNRRVAVLGMFLESNAFAREVSELGFRGSVYLEGDEVTADALAEHPRVMGEVSGFYRRMESLGNWEAVPILATMSGGGAADHSFFESTKDKATDMLRAAGPLDADLALESVDVLVAYRTDPHVDQFERGQEAADLLHELCNGMQPNVVAVPLPIVAPNVSLFTDDGPFAELIAKGERNTDPAIANVSILGGLCLF